MPPSLRTYLNDENIFGISLTGAQLGLQLEIVNSRPRPRDHLGYSVAVGKVLWLTARPDILFLDLKKAMRAIWVG